MRVRYLAGLVFAAMLLAEPSKTPVPNRDPLPPDAFYSLPLGTVKPGGWLRNELQLQAKGLSGHLDEFWPDTGSNSAWSFSNASTPPLVSARVSVQTE